MNKFRNFFINNIGWKLVSLILATILWLIGMNINDPEMTKSFQVKLTLENTNVIGENGLVLLNEDALKATNVLVKVRANKLRLDSITSSQIKASIDFNNIDVTNVNYVGTPKSVGISVTVPSNCDYVDNVPRTAEVLFDKFATKDFDVNVTKIGVPDKNHAAVDPQVSPKQVTLSGAQSQIALVDAVNTTVDVSGKTANVDIADSPVDAYDKDGNKITDLFTINPSTVAVTIPIDTYAQIPIISPTWTGTVPRGYKITDVSMDPKFVEVLGSNDDISKVPSITLPPLDVAGATSDVTKTYKLNDLLVGTNLSKKNGTAENATVTIKVEEITSKTLDVGIGNFTIENQTGEVELPATVPVTITGTQTNVNATTASDISGTIDLGNLTEGDNTIPVNVIVSNKNVTAQSPVEITVKNAGTAQAGQPPTSSSSATAPPTATSSDVNTTSAATSSLPATSPPAQTPIASQ